QVCIESYLDLSCPFSGRFYQTAFREVAPMFEAREKGRIEWIFHQVPQPWHPQSTLLHESALAVKKVKPDAFFDYCSAIFEARDPVFIDDNTMDLTRNQIYDKLADIGEKVSTEKAEEGVLAVLLLFGSSGSGHLLAFHYSVFLCFMLRLPSRSVSAPAFPEPKLALKGAGDKGTHLTQDVKWICRHHRERGVHVTPTVFVNGIEATEISSSWTIDEWQDFLDEMLAA
ncbi:unnamed protein product, partial [Phaeothamnion confervicola]